jgi:hypothetical protein
MNDVLSEQDGAWLKTGDCDSCSEDIHVRLAAQLATTTEQLKDAEALLVGAYDTPPVLFEIMVKAYFAKYPGE